MKGSSTIALTRGVAQVPADKLEIRDVRCHAVGN